MRFSHLFCDLPVGMLRCSTAKHDNDLGGRKAQRDEKQRNFKIYFVPPAWISTLSLQCNINLQWPSSIGPMSIQARLNPLTVNRNPLLMKALKELDLLTLQSLIEQGVVKPSDHVLDSSTPPNMFSLIDVRSS